MGHLLLGCVLGRFFLTLFCCLLHFATVGQANGQFTTILNIPPDPNIWENGSIGSGTQLNLFEGNYIGDGFDAGARDGSSANVEVNVLGGSVGSFRANNGSTVNISGGSVVGGWFSALGGSEVSISGGAVGPLFAAREGSTVTISGGSFGDFFSASDDSKLKLSGGAFYLDGVLINGLDMPGSTLILDSIGPLLSGTLADGTPFAFSNHERVFSLFNESIGRVTLEAAALPAIGPAMITLPRDLLPLGIRNGQTLVVGDGGSVGNNFNAGLGSTVNVTGGQVGGNFEAVGAQVNISGGTVGDHFDAFGGSVVNISGGTVGDDFDAFDGSEVNLFGTEFVLDGMDITTELIPNEPRTITDRGVILSGLLADASAFSFVLNSASYEIGFFDDDATLTVTLVQPGDTNADGLVNIDDLSAVRDHFGKTGNADGTLPGDAVPWDGVVNIDDLNAVRNNFGAGAAAVPEPSALVSALLAAVVLTAVSQRRLTRSC